LVAAVGVKSVPSRPGVRFDRANRRLRCQLNDRPGPTVFIEPLQEKTMQSRRQFMFKIVPAIAVGGLVAREAFAQAKVDEADPAAKGLGYKNDATKVEKAKFPKYAAGQVCGNCQLFQGKPTDAAGNCAIFPGKQVNGKGWCNAYVKKA
jgi:hypothetical protein